MAGCSARLKWSNINEDTTVPGQHKCCSKSLNVTQFHLSASRVAPWYKTGRFAQHQATAQPVFPPPGRIKCGDHEEPCGGGQLLSGVVSLWFPARLQDGIKTNIMETSEAYCAMPLGRSAQKSRRCRHGYSASPTKLGHTKSRKSFPDN